MIIRKAEAKQFQAVRELYYDIIDAVGDSGDSVGWKRDIYPAPDFLFDSIRRGELFIAEEGDTIVGAMVLNHLSNEEYQSFDWPTQAEESEITVIHALGIRPSCRGKGCARQMVRFALDHARENGQKVIRLDVLKGNVAAKKLYTGMGFRYLHSLPMYYEDTGWTDFELYEYPL
jgi:ribosomal protein S18 acetylase RimI-like enzyme